MKSFKIRNIEINHPLVLSPMAGGTDFTFRQLIKRCGGVRVFCLVFIAVLLFSLFIENVFAQNDSNLPTKQNPVLKRRAEKTSSNQESFVRGCGETNGFWICGRVIDADGKPVSGIDVELSSAYYEKDSPLYYRAAGLTDKDGYFKGLHYNAAPGTYVISVSYLNKPRSDHPFPTTFYPNAKTKNKAKVFTLDSKIDFEPIVFQLPQRLVERKISLNVFYEDGSPAEDVLALLENNQHSNHYENHGWITDENGFVEMAVYADKGYQIIINAKRSVGGKEVEYYVESEVFELGDEMLAMKLILQAKK